MAGVTKRHDLSGLRKWGAKRIRRERKKLSLVPTTVPKDEWTKRTRGKLVSKENEAEEHVEALLQGGPFRFNRERPIKVNDRRYFIDFLVTSHEGKRGRKKVRVAIEVDGGYHNTSEQRKKDVIKDADLLKSSRVWAVLRITAEKAMTLDSSMLGELILSAAMGRTTKHSLQP